MKQIETQTYIHLIVDGSLNGDAVEQSNTPCGARRRNTSDFGYDNVSHTFDRGYTGHEHLYNFGLINMNGRLYDPILGRMLSPDVVIQDEQSSQAYNRYSYCLNNPLRFTDPSGYVVRGYSSLFNGFSLFIYENHQNKGVFFNTDEALGQQLPKIEPFAHGVLFHSCPLANFRGDRPSAFRSTAKHLILKQCFFPRRYPLSSSNRWDSLSSNRTVFLISSKVCTGITRIAA